MRSPSRLIVSVLVLLPLLLQTSLSAGTIGYQVRCGNRLSTNWVSSPSAGPGLTMVVSNRIERTSLSVSALSPATLDYHSHAMRSGDFFHARAAGGTVSVISVKDCRTNTKLIAGQIDPWIQDISVIPLSRLLPSGTELRYWSLQESSLKPYQLMISREGIETVQPELSSGKGVECVLVIQTARGVPRQLWCARYWYRKSDGILLKEEAVFGGPGTPKTVVELISRE